MDSEETLKALQEQLAALTSTLASASEQLKPLENAEVELNSQIYQVKQNYNEQIAQLNKKKIELNEQKFTAQKIFNSAKMQANQLAGQMEQIKQQEAKKKAEAEAALKEAEQYKALGERFDNATMHAPWREWAKDHQISAGHKIVQDRYVILADPMGLGKTLSAVITADMAEKITKNTNPEFPFLGIEEEVYVPARTVWTDAAFKAYLNREWPFDGALYDEIIINEIPFPVGNQEVSQSQTPTPFEEITSHYSQEYYYKGAKFAPGEKIPFMQYDLKNRLLNAGMLEDLQGGYETQITNSVTRPVGRKVLYFCPSPLLRNVLEEWRRWAPHRNVTYIGNMSKGERNFVLDLTLPKLNEYVIIVNYEAWRRDKSLLDKLASCRFDTIIIDEAHNIKDMKTSAYKGVAQIVEAHRPEYLIPMTGTPILNRPQELFPLLHLINPKDFVVEKDFLWRYCEEYYPNGIHEAPKWKFKSGGLELLAKKISKNFLRRTKDQAGIILPEKTVIYHELDRDDEQYADQAKAREHMKKYATIVIDAAAGKALQATVIIALLTRLRQIETWPAGIIQRDKHTKEITLQLDVFESQKIDYIIRLDKDTNEWEGLIPDTVEDERIVVFSQFKAPLHELKERIEKMGYKAVVFDGDTPQNLRDDIRHDFDRSVTPDRSKAKWDVLLANYKAAGVGLNLTGATQMVTLDEEWNPGKREQAFDRIHRIGQTHNVTINVVRTKKTVDTWLADIIEQKESVVDGFESAMGAVDLKDALDSGLI